jgi:hypothetical protein
LVVDPDPSWRSRRLLHADIGRYGIARVLGDGRIFGTLQDALAVTGTGIRAEPPTDRSEFLSVTNFIPCHARLK